eukprot:1161285-Pelagomonas_calceolata.AAC.2
MAGWSCATPHTAQMLSVRVEWVVCLGRAGPNGLCCPHPTAQDCNGPIGPIRAFTDQFQNHPASNHMIL